MSAQPFAPRALVASLLIAAVACDDQAPAPAPIQTPPAVASVQIDAAGELTLVEGAWRQLQATARDAAGRVLADRPINWTTSDPSVAIVTSSGSVAALRAGTATIRATAEGRSAGVTVIVAPPPVVAVEVDPPSGYVSVGDAIVFNAVARGAGNVILDRPITWASSDEAVASVDGSGRVRGRAPGTAMITAAAGGQSRTVRVTVVQWTSRPLLRVNGATLPTTMYTVVHQRPGGSTQAVRVDAYGGVFKMSLGYWEHDIRVWLIPEGAVGDHASMSFSGTYQHDVVTGEIIFYSMFGLPYFRGTLHENGTLEFAQLVEGGAPAVRFVYGTPVEGG
ncbi:MAG TPA: Ig-like domain-containing protein [Gemmatimonadaceae bacterium]|nr:Ig-like domain-containing protein [Gemmatimonadaceae bacterium]